MIGMMRKRSQRHLDLVLAVLAAKPGGCFVYDIWRLTRVPPGAIYVALARLERAMLVSSCWQEQPPPLPRRRLYQATDAGRTAAASC